MVLSGGEVGVAWHIRCTLHVLEAGQDYFALRILDFHRILDYRIPGYRTPDYYTPERGCECELDVARVDGASIIEGGV